MVSSDVSLLTDERLFESCGVRVAFSGRAGGVSAGEYASLNMGEHVGDDPDAVDCNRRRLLAALGVQESHGAAADGAHGATADGALGAAEDFTLGAQSLEGEFGTPAAQVVVAICPNQVHGTDGVVVREGFDVASVQDAAAAGADLVAVEAPGVCALMNFADCLPLIVVSPTGRFVVAHAGWRGAVAGIAGIAVRALEELDRGEAGASFYNAYIGPHIRSECFEVGEDVAARFRDAYGEGVIASERHVDLARAVTCDLVRAGIVEDRIADAGICTKCHPDQYFSYRATEGRCGRHAAVAFRCN